MLTAMKNFIIIPASVIALFIVSCASSKEIVSEQADKARPDEGILRNAIESRSFIIKLERLYTYGGSMDLRPRSNYIIVDGNKAVINAAYIGRQYDVRPIAAINMRGTATVYEVTNKLSKGLYDIRLKVENRGAAFDVFLTIGKDGAANASVNSIRINNARYRGYVVPLQRVSVPLQDHEPIMEREII